MTLTLYSLLILSFRAYTMSNEETQDLTQFQHDYEITDCLGTLELAPNNVDVFGIIGRFNSNSIPNLA